jgi:hypothetical protein
MDQYVHSYPRVDLVRREFQFEPASLHSTSAVGEKTIKIEWPPWKSSSSVGPSSALEGVNTEDTWSHDGKNNPKLHRGCGQQFTVHVRRASYRQLR